MKLDGAPVENKMQENGLRWLGYMQQRPISAPIRRSDRIVKYRDSRIRSK